MHDTGKVLAPKGRRKPEIWSIKSEHRPSEPELVNTGVGIGLRLLGSLYRSADVEKFPTSYCINGLVPSLVGQKTVLKR